MCFYSLIVQFLYLFHVLPSFEIWVYSTLTFSLQPAFAASASTSLRCDWLLLLHCTLLLFGSGVSQGKVVTARVLFALLGPTLSSGRPLLLGLRVALVALCVGSGTLTGPMHRFQTGMCPFPGGPASVTPGASAYMF